MNYSEIIVEKKIPAVWVTINKPQRKNALGKQTFLELSALLDEIEGDPTVVGLVFKGAGDTFCAGIDLKDAAGSTDPAERLAFKRLSSRVFERIKNLNKVVIAMVQGYAMAGGLELVLLCDVAIADEDSKIGDGHIKTGLIPNGGGTQLLPRLIGVRKAKELLYTGDIISGKEAERIGLVNKAVPASQLVGAVESIIAKLADKPPLALAAMKIAVDHGMESSLESGLELEAHVVRGLEATQDFKESMDAFMQKRKPVYKGV